jgi:hypothetical protein
MVVKRRFVMKKLFLILVLISVAAAFIFADTFSLRNGTSIYTLNEVYIAHPDTMDWGDDLLGSRAALKPGERFRIELQPAWNGSVHIQAVDEDGDTYTLYDVKIKRGDTVTVTLDDLD